jgi:hypothetical protein
MSMRAAPPSPRRRAIATSLIALSVAAAAPRVSAQSADTVPVVSAPRVPQGDSMIVYRREVFRYAALGRPDPFRSLVGSAELGVRVEDLTLRGVVHHPDPSRSVAVLAREGVERPVRARVGDVIGGVRIVAIRPTSVDVLVEEFGIAHRETLRITKATPKGTNP